MGKVAKNQRYCSVGNVGSQNPKILDPMLGFRAEGLEFRVWLGFRAEGVSGESSSLESPNHKSRTLPVTPITYCLIGCR